jgi:hypothetical protein
MLVRKSAGGFDRFEGWTKVCGDDGVETDLDVDGAAAEIP